MGMRDTPEGREEFFATNWPALKVAIKCLPGGIGSRDELIRICKSMVDIIDDLRAEIME